MFEWYRRWRLGKQYGYEVLFKGQDRQVQGKPGVILADMGMPEDFDPQFYLNYLDHIFHYTLPRFLHPIVLADRGIVLIDPHNPLAREPFQPRQLVDMHGSFTNRAGRPYVECEVTWRPPGMKKNPADYGYFLYTAEGKGGAPDICQKSAARVVGWYYGHLLPEKKIAFAQQCGGIYEDAADALKARYPQAEIRHARYVYKDSLRQAVEDLLAAGCGTILYQCTCNPIYTDVEEYAYALPLLHQYASGRAVVIMADQLGSQAAMRQAYLANLRDRLAELPENASVLVILSKHGHPFKRETQDLRGPEFRDPLESEARQLLAGRDGHWDLVWSQDEYADPYWDPKRTKFSTHDAYRKAIEEGYDYALEVPTEFVAENTDLMILHAMHKFKAFRDYDPFDPIPYPDWEQPLIRRYTHGKTTGIYAGCPVGPYRKYIVEAIVNSVGEVLDRRS